MKLEKTTAIPEVKKTIVKIRQLSGDDRVRQEAFYRERRLHDEATALGTAHREGIKIGIEQGLKQGIEQGRKQGMEQGIEQGRKQGMEQGIEQGRKQGMEQGKAQIIQMLLANGMSEEELQKYLNAANNTYGDEH